MPTFNLKPGTEFTHKFWLDGDKPLRCRVTAIRKGIVYYRGVYAELSGAPQLGGGFFLRRGYDSPLRRGGHYLILYYR